MRPRKYQAKAGQTEPLLPYERLHFARVLIPCK